MGTATTATTIVERERTHIFGSFMCVYRVGRGDGEKNKRKTNLHGGGKQYIIRNNAVRRRTCRDERTIHNRKYKPQKCARGGRERERIEMKRQRKSRLKSCVWGVGVRGGENKNKQQQKTKTDAMSFSAAGQKAGVKRSWAVAAPGLVQ